MIPARHLNRTLSCSYCSTKDDPRTKYVDENTAVCPKCAPLHPLILTTSQGDGIATLREMMVRQNDGDFLRKSISTVSIQILVYFDAAYKLVSFEITHHLLKVMIKWRIGGAAVIYATSDTKNSYWNHNALRIREGFDLTTVTSEIKRCASNLHPFVLDFLMDGLGTNPAVKKSEISGHKPISRPALDFISSSTDLHPSEKAAVVNTMEMTTRPPVAASTSITPEERSRAEAINALIHELIQAKHALSSDPNGSHDTIFTIIPEPSAPTPKKGLSPDTKILICAVTAEVIYIISVRILVTYYTGSPVAKEIYWTLLRLGSLVFLWRLLRKFRPPEKSTSNLVSTGLVSCLIFAAPYLVGQVKDPINVAHVFAATSIVVGFREEFFYRGILQSFLRTKFRLPLTLLISNLLFLFYHYGVQPFTPENILALFLAGTVFGLAYERTGSLAFVALLHGAYDIEWAYSPYISIPFPDYVAVLILFSTALILGAISPRNPTISNHGANRSM